MTGRQKQRVAVFDVDGTIFRSSLLIQVVEALIESGAFPERARKEFEHERQLWLDREGDYESYIDAVVRTFRTHLKGVRYQALVDAAELLLAEIDRGVAGIVQPAGRPSRNTEAPRPVVACAV